MLLPLVETDKDDDNDDASSTALSLAADGSNAPPASTTALDHPVDGSNAPLASTTALGLLADGSDLSEEGDATDAGSDGNDVGPLALLPRTPLAFLLCNNQPFFQFFDKEMQELGSRRQRLPRDETRQVFQPRMMGGLGTTALADRPPAA